MLNLTNLSLIATEVQCKVQFDGNKFTLVKLQFRMFSRVNLLDCCLGSKKTRIFSLVTGIWL